MTVHYGKRNLGAGTAASPGDTLYIPLNFFNDSGASIGIGSSLAVTDIEVFKNGSVTQRATDSGYALLGDTGNFDNRIGFKGISISLFNTADDASFYANGSTYWVAIDSVTVDGRTVRFFPAVFEIGEPRANVTQLNGDTGAANRLEDTFANGFNDTGITNRFDRIQFEVDTGLRVHIDDLDTGLHAHISDVDTGIHSILQTVGVLVAAFSDTGVNQRLSQIQSDVDTGLRTHVNDLDTGLHDTLADYDTGMRALLALRDTGAIATAVWAGDTGIRTLLALRDTGAIANAVWNFATRSITASSDTGINDRLARILSDTDTGIQSSVNVTSIADTGINDRLGVGVTFDTGGWAQVNIRKVNSVRVVGTGDTGTPDTWRPTT